MKVGGTDKPVAGPYEEDPLEGFDPDAPYEDPEPPEPTVDDYVDLPATERFLKDLFDPECETLYDFAKLKIGDGAAQAEYAERITDLWPGHSIHPRAVRILEELVADAVQRHQEIAERTVPPSLSASPFEFTRASRLRNRPRTGWLIDRILMERSFNVLYGPAGCGKSFLALDWVMSIVHGIKWQGQEAISGAVGYIAAEGSAELEPRISAWHREHDCDEEDIVRENLYVLGEAPELMDPANAIKLAMATWRIRNLKLIVIDTMARTMVGGDENAAKDVGLFIKNIELLRYATGAAILLIHHVSKQGDIRGSTALPGAATTLVSLRAPKGANGGLVLECTKQKEEAAFKPISLSREVIDVGDGVTSCVIRDWDPIPSALNPNTAAACRILVEKFGEQGASYTDWRNATTGAAAMSDSSFRRAVTALKDEGYVVKAAGKTGAYRPTPKAKELLDGSMPTGPDLSAPQLRTGAA